MFLELKQKRFPSHVTRSERDASGNRRGGNKRADRFKIERERQYKGAATPRRKGKNWDRRKQAV